MTDADLYFAATSLDTPIAAAMASGDFQTARDLATVGMDNADSLLCRIEDGDSMFYGKRGDEISKLWSDLYTAQILATNALRLAA